ncbi:MAG: hypothetical protein KKG21_05305 [Candidatus Omnitrophica bacterium]|nr:hypothetical protein [Candidatus Omnitrophota bacterium]
MFKAVDVNAGDILILADSWFPGWECYDNGKKVESFDADGFRGYHIEETGHHEIEWIYKPLSFLIGLIISAIGFIAFLLFVKVKRT